MRTPGFSLTEDLSHPEAYTAVLGQCAAPRLIETHISWVFIHERDVFKVKKPVGLGFLDFREPEQRRVACEAEVRLNSRLASHVYRGVVPICRGSNGRANVNGDGPTVDWAVHMGRLNDEVRADRLLERGELSGARIAAIAKRLTDFHASVPQAAMGDHLGDRATLESQAEENFRQTAECLTKYLQPSEARELIAWQRGFIREHKDLLDDRVRTGRVREGHGDLRLEHVYFEKQGITIIDCVEFDPRYRVSDVCSDVAFLSMDLAAHRRVDIAEQFLAAYARESNDFDLYALVDFYESYRAYVRGKIAALMSIDPDAGDARRLRAEHEARQYFLLALSANRKSLLRPAVLAVGGLMASGKSTVAERLGSELSAPVISADRVRKALLDVTPTERLEEPVWTGAYDPRLTELVYADILRSAVIVLRSGRPVVLDASFRAAAWRDAARKLALTYDVPFRFIECKTPREVSLRRLAERERTPNVSDGRRAIFDAFSARFEPVDELAPPEHLIADTTEPIETTLGHIRDATDVWPRHLVA